MNIRPMTDYRDAYDQGDGGYRDPSSTGDIEDEMNEVRDGEDGEPQPYPDDDVEPGDAQPTDDREPDGTAPRDNEGQPVEHDTYQEQQFLEQTDEFDQRLAHLDHHARAIADPGQQTEVRDDIKDLRREMGYLRDRLDALLAQSEEQQRLAVEMTTRVDLMQGQVTELQEAFIASRTQTEAQPGEQAAVEGEVESLLRGLLRSLRRMFRTLWRLVSSLLTPKEWTLKAKGGLVDVEIKFGR